MSRNPKIETKLLIDLIYKFYIEKCDKDASKLKIPQIGEFVRAQGYDVEDYLIRRNEEARNYIQSLHNNSVEEHIYTVVAYRDLDINAFLTKNNTPDKLRKAIKEREDYYRELSASASYFIKENQSIATKISQYNDERVQLKKALNEVTAQKECLTQELKKLQSDYQKLLHIVEDYVYPEVANELLKKDGLIKQTAEVVVPEKIEESIVGINTDVSAIKNHLIKDLFRSL